MEDIALIGISGSLRSGSLNTAVLNAVLGRLPEGVSARVAEIGALPLYNEDRDGEHQAASVRDLRAAIAACDGIVVCSPEYNNGVPGVLKNAIDWLSRPAHRSPLKGKHALMVSASTSFVGGARMQAQLRCDLSACEVRVVARPQVVIGQAQTKANGGRFTDEATLGFSADAVADLISEIRIHRAGIAALARHSTMARTA